MTTDDTIRLAMGKHRWYLSGSGAVLRHRVDELDQLHMVDDPETARQTLGWASGEYQEAVASASRMWSRHKATILLVNSLLCLGIGVPFAILPNPYVTVDKLIFVWIFVIALFLLIFFNQEVTDTLRSKPGKELKFNVEAISREIERCFPVTVKPEHPDVFMRHMRPVDARAVVDSYRSAEPAGPIGPKIVELLDAEYQEYDKQLADEKTHRLAVEARKIIDSLNLPDHPVAAPPPEE